MVFDIGKYRGRYDAMHCNTEEKANAFLTFLRNTGHTLWDDHDIASIEEHNRYSLYKERTCYAFNDHTYCSIDFFVGRGSTILEFDDFEWPNFKEGTEDIDERAFDNMLEAM